MAIASSWQCLQDKVRNVQVVFKVVVRVDDEINNDNNEMEIAIINNNINVINNIIDTKSRIL